MHSYVERLRQAWYDHRTLAIVSLLLIFCLGTLSTYLQGVDYRPLIWALRIELAGGSAYGSEMDALFHSTYSTTLAEGGFAYPLPAMWLAVPIFLLPDVLAKAVWCVMCFGSLLLGLYLLRMPAQYFLFVPVLWSVSELQNTVLLVGLLLLGIWSLNERRWWLLSCIVALTLGAKPQATLIIAGALGIGALRARAWHPLVFCALAVLIPTFILEPDWVGEWLVSVMRYNGAVGTMWLIAWTPLALLLCVQRQWWSALAVLQVCAFPVIKHHYALSPLLIGYVNFRSSRIAWLAVASSWASVFLVQVAPLQIVLGICYLLPLVIGAYVMQPRAINA